MSDAVVIAVVISIAPTLTALVTWWVQQKKLREIHKVVNSRLDRALAYIKKLEKEIRKLKENQ